MNGQCSFIIQPYRRKYLKAYFKRFSQDDPVQLWDDNVASVLLEQGFSIRQNPRSVYSVEKLYESLMKYEPSRCPHTDLTNEHVKVGLRQAYLAFSRPKSFSVLSISDFTPSFIDSITTNKSGSSGLTNWGVKKKDSLVRAYERGRDTLVSKKAPEPCIAFKRTQFEGKTRLVWGYPYSMTAIEGLFARPLIDRFLSMSTPMSFGKSTGALGCELRTSAHCNRWAYSTDVSSFDSSISPELIKAAFSILSTWFDLDQEISTPNGDKIIARDAWRQVVAYFITTPIVMPDGNLYKGKRHGVPSGSYFTQLIDSVVNTIIVNTISSKFRMGIKRFMVLGDDVLFWSNRNVQLEKIADYASKTFNAKFNANKCGKYFHTEPIKYLGRIWEGGVPDLPVEEIIDRMVQPERFRKYPKDPADRARCVRMLLMSYASVYRSAYRIFTKSLFGGKQWWNPQSAYEFHALRSAHEFSVAKEDNWLMESGSGLQRYLHKYVFTEKTFTSVANSFWK